MSGDEVAVGLVAADHALGAAPGPAYYVEPPAGAAVAVAHGAVALVYGNAVDHSGVIADGGEDHAARDLEEGAGADHRAVLDAGAFEAQARHPLHAQDLDRPRVEDEMQSLARTIHGQRRELAEGGQVLLATAALPFLQGGWRRLGNLCHVDHRRAVGKGSHFPQLDGGELRFRRPPAADQMDVGDRRRLYFPGGMGGHVRRRHLGRRLDQHARQVEGDVAVADDGDAGGLQVRLQPAEEGVAVVPADELGGAEDSRLVAARNVERTVERRPGGQDHGIVMAPQLRQGNVAADGDVAVVVDALILGRLLVGAGYPLGALVIRRHAGTDQAERRRQALYYVDAAVEIPPDQGLGRIESTGTGSHDCDTDGHRHDRLHCLVSDVKVRG